MNRKQRRALRVALFEFKPSPLIHEMFPGKDFENLARGFLAPLVNKMMKEAPIPESRVGVLQIRSVIYEEMTVLVDLEERSIIVGFSSEVPGLPDHQIVKPYESTPEEWDAKRQYVQAMNH
jgi:hypothetical protein